MIQRIQTIWLFLAGLCALLTLKFTTYGFYTPVQSSAGAFNDLNGISGGVFIMLVTIATAVVSFVAIGLYKTRKMQIKLCLAGILLEALLLFLYYRQISQPTNTGTISITAFLHLLVFVFLALAAKGINADEKLIKESDRLR